MLTQKIKEEPSDDVETSNIDDEIIASYDIVNTNNPKFKIFTVSGLSNILNKAKHYDVSIRTDLKEMKVASKIGENLSIFYTKETNLNLDKKAYALRFYRETDSVYFVPIHSSHSISFLDESNKSNKAIDSQNSIYEDCFKMPHPSRNKHDQLCIEMKNYLYKPLKCVLNPDHVKRFLNEVYTSTNKRNPQLNDNSKVEVNQSNNDLVDLTSCPHWYMTKVNLYDIKRIEIVELKIEVLLRKGQVLRFYEIKDILDIDIPKLINVLQTIGHLIRGNWVIKSNLLYKYNAFHDSEAKQNHYKELAVARDFLLWSIATNRQLKFETIYPKYKKSTDHEDILNRLTTRNGVDGIVDFIMEEDKQFLVEFSQIASKHHQKTITLLSKHQNYLDL